MLGMLGRGGVGAGVESSAGRALPPAAVDHSGEGASPATGLARMVAARRTAGAGFTLVELLVAIALGVLLMGIVTVTFARVSEVFNLATARIEAVQNGRVALDMLAHDLEGATIDSVGNAFQATPDVAAWNGLNGKVNGTGGLWFTTSTTGNPGQKVLYYLGQPLGPAFDAGCNTLKRYTSTRIGVPGDRPTLDAATAPLEALAVTDAVLAYGIRSWQLRYLDRTQAEAMVAAQAAGSWNTAWNSLPGQPQAGRKPAAVLVHIELIDRKGRLARANQPVIMERVIRLDARGIDE